MTVDPPVAEGGPLFVTEKSACWTVVEAIEVSFSLLGSAVLVEAVTRLPYVVPDGVPVGMFVTSVKFAVVPAAIEADEQVTVPPEPTAGVVQLNPAGAVTETNVMLPGRVSVIVALPAATLLALVRLIV